MTRADSKNRLITGGESISSDLQFKDNGLLPAIIQDADSGEVLMLGYMNEEAVERTLNSGEVWFYSRSRKEMWHKGATSGNRFIVQELWRDCDSDTILAKVRPLGPACHTGNRTCFFQRLESDTS
jgi:phosphoribosyl-AMP cyclohydrolase